VSLEARMNDLVVSDAHETTEEELREAHIRPTGEEHFRFLSREEQDAMLGPVAAEKVRTGELTLSDLVERPSPGGTPGFIVQKPDSALP
jgi:hypothetical protein